MAGCMAAAAAGAGAPATTSVTGRGAPSGARRIERSTGLARRHVGVPPRADVGGAQIIAVHDIERLAAAAFGNLHAQRARLVAAFVGEPHAVVAPQTWTLGALMR